MSWHGACASGTCRVLSVASLHWFKMDAAIPAPAAREVRSVMKFLNAQGIAPIEIYHQLCQVYGPNVMSKQMVRCWCRQFSAGRQNVSPDAEDTGPRSQWLPSVLTLKEIPVISIFRMTERRRWFQPQAADFYDRDTKVGPTVGQMSEFRWWICWKIAQHIPYLLQ